MPTSDDEFPPGALKLLRDGHFDPVHTDDELESEVAQLAVETQTPHAELLRRMLGMEEPDEEDAKVFFRRLLDHRQRLTRLLGRPVHVRVAALDLSTTRPSLRHDSRPIVLTSSLLEKALEEASSDAVTGLPQRAQFVGLLRYELCQRRRRSVAVVYVDLDGMKRVNDTFGHSRGDDVLRELARCGRASLREGDVLARIGGDEFALLLVDVTPAEAEAAVRRLRERFESHTSELGTSFSAGIAIATVRDTAEALLARADDAMYRDKRARAAR